MVPCLNFPICKIFCDYYILVMRIEYHVDHIVSIQ